MKRLLIILIFLYSFPAGASDLYMVRSQQDFPEAMLALQQAIRDEGYTLSRVQRVDIGLNTFGYKTDKYRVVFFGKPDEIREISRRHIALVPYLPLKIAVFAEGGDTLLLASSFHHLTPLFADPDLQARFRKWEADIHAILARVK